MSCMPNARLEKRLDLGSVSIRAMHLIGLGYESPSRQLSLVFGFGIDVVMMNIPIPLRQ